LGNTGSRTGVGSASSTSRTYPANGTIPDAYFTIDPETRRVVVIAPEEAMPYVMQVLTNLDKPKPQVLIKVVFLELTHNNALDIGVEGGWTKSIGGGNTGNASDVFGLGGLTSATSNLQFNAVGQPINSFQAAGPLTSQGAGLYQVLGANYQVTLRAIAQAGSAKVLSRPSILARNNQPAQIVVGEQVPLITSVSYNGLNGTPINAVSYENVGVILNVTPFITSDGLVEMIVAPQVSAIDPTLSVPISAGVNAPVIDTRSANTVAVTPDGQTVILGGLIQNSKSVTDTKIPFLGDIPVLGNLFKRKQTSEVQTELIIFLTPYIVEKPSELAALSSAERARSREMKSLSEKELEQFLDELPKKKPGAK
jgi:general secretion pathway protein D